MNKYRILVTAILIITMTFVYIPAFGVEEEPETKYHLDMGVWSIPQASRGLLNTTQTYYIDLTFGSDVEVEKVEWLTEKYIEDNNFWETASMNCVTGSDGQEKHENYDDTYGDYVTSSLTNISTPEVDGKNVSYNCKVKLTGKTQTYNIGKVFELFYKDKVQVEEDRTIVSVPVISEADKQRYTTLWQSYYAKYGEYNAKASSSTGKQAQYYRNLASEAYSYYVYYKGLANDNRTVRVETINTQNKLIDEDLQNFKSMIYSFWGGEANMKTGDAGLRGIYNSIEQTAALNISGTPTDHYLVFFPTVLSYHTKAPETPVPPEGTTPAAIVTSDGCVNHIEWSETEHHTYYHSPGCKTRTVTTGYTEDGTPITKTVRYCPGHPCTHTYYYSLDIDVGGAITADKPNGGPTTFKSGYGFSLTAYDRTTTADIKLVRSSSSYSGCNKNYKKSNATVSGFTNAEVRLPAGSGWDVSNPQKGTRQARVIPLVRNGTTFTTPANPVSHYNNRLIYTGVALPGTRQSPVTHQIPVWFSGSWLRGSNVNVELCGYINPALRITINGNMYEDDSTQDNTR